MHGHGSGLAHLAKGAMLLFPTFITGCAVFGGCDFESTARDLAGDNAVDCGEAGIDADRAAPWACTLEPFRAGEAFYLRFASQGIDSRIHSAVVSDGTSVWLLHQDSESPHEVTGHDCVDPFEATETADNGESYTYIGCTSTFPVNNSYQVCGNCPGCEPDHVPFNP